MDFLKKIEKTLKQIENEYDKNKKSKILIDLFNEYEKMGITKSHLAQQYLKYPTLTIISPNLENVSFINKNNTIHIKDSDIIEKTTLEKSVICNIFNSNNTGFSGGDNKVLELIKYIENEIYDKLLKRRFKFDVFGKTHSQLWFLPTICSSIVNPKIKKLTQELTALKPNKHIPKNRDIISKKTEELNKLRDTVNSTTIEKMTRFLAILLMNNQKFRKNYKHFIF